MSIIKVMKNILRPIKLNIKNKSYFKNGVKIAENVTIIDSKFDAYVNLALNSAIVNSEIGKYSSIGRYSKIENVKMGKFCSIAWDITIGAPSHPFHHISSHAITYRHTYGFVNETRLERKTTEIGNDVWIGCNSVIVEGVKVGDGAIIGAGAVVTKDVPPYAIVVGVPAKVIKYRFTKEIVEKLLSMSWWSYDEEFLKENINYFVTEVNIKKLEDLEKKYNEKCFTQN